MLSQAIALVSQIPDPEIPALTLSDLGILRSVRLDPEHGGIVVELTPTYSGCPATEAIQADVKQALRQAGFTDYSVNIVLAPAWSSDWITPEGRNKLRDYGIAPPACGAPQLASSSVVQLTRRNNTQTPVVACPRCASVNTTCLSEFGSTPCKALYRCLACQEPFDYFKPY
jgi:ring-1,2-phenylacetyl-CoA epoxidase subunit PaaD